jgi:hypothetical protein
MPNAPVFVDLKRVNITIEERLHQAATRRAKDLGLDDGFAGLVSRLLIKDQQRKSPSVARISRRFKASRS